jgi:hypothetical protein
VHVTRGAQIPATVFCVLARNIYSTVIVVIFPFIQKSSSVPMHWTQSTRWRWSSQVTPEWWVLSFEHDACYPPGPNLDWAPRFIENYWTPESKLPWFCSYWFACNFGETPVGKSVSSWKPLVSGEGIRHPSRKVAKVEDWCRLFWQA